MRGTKRPRAHQSRPQYRDLNCTTRQKFNEEGETKGLCYAAHKTDDMVDVVNKTCQSEWCLTHVHEKYDGYCLRCYMHIFPNVPVAHNYKTKEFTVVEFVKGAFAGPDWRCDRRVPDGCSRRRPDLLCDFVDQVLIVEVDENQHTYYDCSCENKRLMKLSRDVDHRPVVFVRFNLDAYMTAKVDGESTTVKSCWSINK